MSTLNDIDVGLPLPGATVDELAQEVRNLKSVLKTVLLHAHKPNGAIVGTAVGALGAGVVGTPQLADGAVTGVKIGATTITGANIASATITGDKLAAGFITSAMFSSSCIPGTAFQPGSIPFSAFIGQLETAHITDNAITSAKIASGAVTDAKIASITYGKIAAGSATNGQYMAYDSVTGWGPTAAPTLPSIALATFGEESASDGGNAPTAATWYKRTIAEQIDASNIMSIASSKITLVSGDYFIFVRCPAHEVKRHQIRLVRETISGGALTTIAVGSGAYAFTGSAEHSQTDSILFHAFNNPDESTYRYYIEHFFEVVAEADDFGNAIGAVSGENCMHTSGFIFKLP